TDRETVAASPAAFIQLLAASAVLASTALPIPGPAVAGLMLATDLPALRRAAGALRGQRLDGSVLEAASLLLRLGRGQYVASALLSWLRSFGEFIVATSVGTARRSLHELLAEPGQRVTRVRGAERRAVGVDEVRAGDVVSIGTGERIPIDGT